MASIKLPADFSALPVVLKVEQKFGIAGYARMIKLLELLAVSPVRHTGVIELSESDWQEALQLGPALLSPFLSYLSRADWLSVEQSVEQGSLLRVTVIDFFPFLPAADAPGLFTTPEQWCAWCAHELGMPPAVGTDPQSTRMFRRWCATNVTVVEVEAAIELAVRASEPPVLVNLHKHLKTVRTTKIEQASR